jgi:ribose 5-phosphate isomerase B
MSSKMTIAIASDLSGFPLKTAVVEYLEGREDVTVMDFGIDDPEKPQPYTAQAPKVASAVQSGKAEKGILICGTGQGMAIVANKHKGVYACVADSVFSGERSKIINNANVLTMGGWITARSWVSRLSKPGCRWHSLRRWSSKRISWPRTLPWFRSWKRSTSNRPPEETPWKRTKNISPR